jgi:Carboxypeptidase regulatory-like domain
MIARRKIVLFLSVSFWALASFLALSQTQTTGRLVGTVADTQGAAIVGAEILVENLATADKRATTSDRTGGFSLPSLSPANYDLRIEASGFSPAVFHNIAVGPSETRTVNTILQVAKTRFEVNVSDAPPLLRSDSSELSTTLDSRSLTELPLPTRNFLQLLTLATGVTAPLTNNNVIGRNSPNVSVNGSRVTQNNYRINGVDANDLSLHVFADVGVPAPESVTQVNVQTSVYDASVAGAGGSVQVVTKSGSNFLHGGVYEYLRNEAFNANDANLEAVGEHRPVMRRNVYGATLGGPLRRNKAFFFASYQGTRQANGATDQSLYKSVLIAPGLTDDRSAATLMSTFGVGSNRSDCAETAELQAAKRAISDSHTSDCQWPSYGDRALHLSRGAVQYQSRLPRNVGRPTNRQVLFRPCPALQRS